LLKELPTDFKLNEDHQNISELWESLADLAKRRVDDNAKSKSYPLETRKIQLSTARALLKCIADTHTEMDKE
tara:strand:- start:107 stop:322 length:216 start_codon:yes stop_codon:yes gene_type:complete